ncbi:MAG: RNA methyltransferase [Stenomitos frigidus ULC029]
MAESVLATIRIVLVEPAGALNVGAIARVMKNMGLQHLVLVNPQCDRLGADALLMAVHAADVLAAATVVATLPEALHGCQRAIATTARPRVDTILESPRTALPWLLEPLPLETGQAAGALIFGPEDRGLSNEELNYAQRFVAIPSHPDYAALNLAQAVAICCYELYHLAPAAAPLSVAPLPLPASLSPLPFAPASLDVLEGYYQQLETVLLAIGYLHPHTAASRMHKFRRLFNRALPSSDEVAMLRGILSQVAWATQKAGVRDKPTKSDRTPTDD